MKLPVYLIVVTARFLAFAQVAALRLAAAVYVLGVVPCMMSPSVAAAENPVTVLANQSYGPDQRQVLDAYAATCTPACPMAVFFYGGFWRVGARQNYAFVGQALARRGISVVIPDYRLYPDTRFPLFLDDAAAAVAWSSGNAGRLGADPRRLFLMGDSNGAYMSVMLALDPAYLRHVGLSPAQLSGVVGIAGLYRVDPAPPGLPEIFGAPHGVEPASFLNGHNPPFLLLAGGRDDVVSPSDTTDFDAAVRVRGGVSRAIIYPNLGHIGIMLPFSPDFHRDTDVLDTIVGFMKPDKP